MKLLFTTCLLLTGILLAAVEKKVFFESTFSPADAKKWTLAPEISSIKMLDEAPALTVTIPPGEERGPLRTARRKIDLTPYRGQLIFIEFEAKADKVSKPSQSWNGVKLMLHCKTPTAESHLNQRGNFGSYDWKVVTLKYLVPADAKEATLHIGLQGSHGNVSVRRVRLFTVPAPFKTPANFKAEYSGQVSRTLPLRGMMGPNAYQPEDLEELATWGANLIRWQVKRNWGKAGTERDLPEYLAWFHAQLDTLDKVLDQCHKLGIRVIIDLHTPPGGRYANRDLVMFHESLYLDAFYRMWEEMAQRYRNHPALWGYDLINEPVQNHTAENDYLAVQYEAAKRIRTIDPETPVIIESDNWCSAGTFTRLQPLPLKNIIYQVHMYTPGKYTHQKINNSWGVLGADEFLTYPGVIDGTSWNREELQRHLQPVREFQEKYGARIYLGEFSAVRYAPGAAQYLEDVISICEEYGWDWTCHAFRESPFWDVEYSDSLKAEKAAGDTDRKKILLRYFRRNQR